MTLKKNDQKFSNVNEAHGWFFNGRVKLLKQGFLSAQYRLAENGATIKVKNSAHVRMVGNQMRLPEVFEIIAPTEAVKEIQGEVPESHNVYLRAEKYVEYQNRYQI